MTLIAEIVTDTCDSATCADRPLLEDLIEKINEVIGGLPEATIAEYCDQRNRDQLPDRFGDLVASAVALLDSSDVTWSPADKVLVVGDLSFTLTQSKSVDSTGEVGHWRDGDGYSWPASGDEDCECWISIRCATTCVYAISTAKTEGFPQEAEIEGIAIAFSPTRTSIIDVRSLDGIPISSGINQSNVVILRPTDPLPAIVQLEVDFTGDPPHVASRSFLLRSPDSREFDADDPHYVRMPYWFQWRDRGALIRHFGKITAKDIVALRDRWASRSGKGERHRRAHRLLLTVDENSLEELVPASDRPAFRNVAVVVSRQYWRRAIAYDDGWKDAKDKGRDGPAVNALEDTKPLDLVGLGVDDAVRQIGRGMHTWLLTGSTTSARGKLRDWFGMFGSGQATAFHCYGGPNGVNAFCFTELALLLADPEHDFVPPGGYTFWLRFALMSAAANEMFAHCYRKVKPPEGGYKVCSYKPEHNPVKEDHFGFAQQPVKPQRTYNAAERKAFHTRWRELLPEAPSEFQTAIDDGTGAEFLRPLRREFGRLVLSALREELNEVYTPDWDLMELTPP